MGIHGNTTTTTIKFYLRYHFVKNALPVSRLHNTILRETTLMLKYIYILRKSILLASFAFKFTDFLISFGFPPLWEVYLPFLANEPSTSYCQ